MSRNFSLFAAVCLLALPAVAQETKTAPATKAPAKKSTTASKAPAKTPAKASAKSTGAPLTTQKQKLSYALGIGMGENFKSQSVDIDFDALMRGMKDGSAGAKPALSEQELRQALETGQKEAATHQAEFAKVVGEKNLREGEAFLAANKLKPGVITTASGLQYQIITPGTGATPKPTDTVTTHYRGTLIDGTEFDSSYKRGEPASFGCTQVIKGWTEALLMMKVGAKWKLFIPSNLAYGERQRSKEITPNSTLIFDIELLAIKETAQPAKQP